MGRPTLRQDSVESFSNELPDMPTCQWVEEGQSRPTSPSQEQNYIDIATRIGEIGDKLDSGHKRKNKLWPVGVHAGIFLGCVTVLCVALALK